MKNHPTPYENLDPSVILDAVESIGLPCNGSLLALNSFENRVYQIGIEDSAPVIAKFYRPGRWSSEAILEEHQFLAELATHEIPVVAPIIFGGQSLHEFQEFRFAVFPRQAGRPLEVDNAEHLEWMGRFIGRLHAVGECKKFEHRIALNIETYGREPYEFLIQNDFVPAELRHNYSLIVESLLEKSAYCFERVDFLTNIRLHGDCHAGNILWNVTGPHIVDLDDCLMGPAIQDLWMLLSGGNEKDLKKQRDCILNGYYEFHDFNPQEFHLVEALRTLRMIYYAGWLAKRWEDPAFPLNFPWFNTPRYWQEHLQHLREQLPLLEQVLEE